MDRAYDILIVAVSMLLTAVSIGIYVTQANIGTNFNDNVDERVEDAERMTANRQLKKYIGSDVNGADINIAVKTLARDKNSDYAIKVNDNGTIKFYGNISKIKSVDNSYDSRCYSTSLPQFSASDDYKCYLYTDGSLVAGLTFTKIVK
jgi:hypothetical protein